ncbi:hypothetical protein PVAP13_5KG373114 [Panicum virgatum]|uniref:[RNA-polymerase]-subunit kinase n=1 Tax=Panicum virgatum TaxID=38727 RepID=A0A8T0SLY9_PANVG|nr:hypothetical protein PVAP13_5KG373114 [Panicum virgatum]
MHSRGVLHRDLKPNSVLLDVRGGVKICNFGLSRAAAADGTNGEPPLTPGVATLWYRVPELILGSQDYDTGVDTWGSSSASSRRPIRTSRPSTGPRARTSAGTTTSLRLDQQPKVQPGLAHQGRRPLQLPRRRHHVPQRRRRLQRRHARAHPGGARRHRPHRARHWLRRRQLGRRHPRPRHPHRLPRAAGQPRGPGAVRARPPQEDPRRHVLQALQHKGRHLRRGRRRRGSVRARDESRVGARGARAPPGRVRRGAPRAVAVRGVPLPREAAAPPGQRARTRVSGGRSQRSGSS